MAAHHNRIPVYTPRTIDIVEISVAVETADVWVHEQLGDADDRRH